MGAGEEAVEEPVEDAVGAGEEAVEEVAAEPEGAVGAGEEAVENAEAEAVGEELVHGVLAALVRRGGAPGGVSAAGEERQEELHDQFWRRTGAPP